MRVVFSDDSGRGSINKEPLTVVAAVMFDVDSQWEPFVTDFENLMETAVGSSDMEPDGHRLIKDSLRGKQKAETLLRGILSLPGKHSIPIFYGVISRNESIRVEDYLQRMRGFVHRAVRTTQHDLAFLDCLVHGDKYAGTARR
jgi:hypothetical protein